MKSERARLMRLQRLEKVRAIAKQTAALEAAQAESTLAQLEALAERTRRLASDYARRDEAGDGAALRQIGHFAGGLQAIYTRTANDAAQARRQADIKHTELAAAERRRAAADDRATRQARSMAKTGNDPVTGTRKALGTGLE